MLRTVNLLVINVIQDEVRQGINRESKDKNRMERKETRNSNKKKVM